MQDQETKPTEPYWLRDTKEGLFFGPFANIHIASAKLRDAGNEYYSGRPRFFLYRDSRVKQLVLEDKILRSVTEFEDKHFAF